MEEVRLVIITGMSGGGKTQVSRIMEDLGYFCVDNLPPMFIPKFTELCKHSSGKVNKVALVIDTRSREFFNALVHILEELDVTGVRYEMLFMEANDEAIIRRYKETRRRHPMAQHNRIAEGIAKEREILKKVRAKATHIIDTSCMPKGKLNETILKLFSEETETERMNINIVSFGFKYGMPIDADMVFDVRFLPNPFYVEELKRKSGAVPVEAEYIAKWPVTKTFLEKLFNMLEFLVPNYVIEGKPQLVIAIGCTGGMHRSVFTANKVYELLKSKGYKVNLEHRDLMKNKVEEHIEEYKIEG